ncbi:TerD family protein [Paenibacillus rhizoplanae]
MGWNEARAGVEIDFSVFLLPASQKVATEKDLIFYGNPAAPDQSVVILPPAQRIHSGPADDTQIAVELSLIPAEVERIAFALTIYEAESRQQSFSQLSDPYLRIMNAADGTELLRYRLGAVIPWRLPLWQGRSTDIRTNGNSARSAPVMPEV